MSATHERRIAGTRVRGDGWVHLGGAPGATHDGAPPQGEALAALVHLSDLHVCDAESPVRLEHLDHHGHPGAPYRQLLGEIGTYRPQEALTVAVAIAMVAAIAAEPLGPVTGRPFDATVLTGDLVDNAQANELDWFDTVLRGGTVRPASGDPDRSGWIGAPDAPWSPHHWHPDGHRSARVDRWVGEHGFPLVAGLVDAARAPLHSPGLPVPWFPVHGNHDALLQGTVPADDERRAQAEGGVRYLDLAAHQSPLVVLEAVPRTGPARYPDGRGAPTATVVADARRRLLAPGQAVDRSRADDAGPSASYSVVVAPGVRLVVLDTVDPHGGWEGSLDRDQLAWLRGRLAAATEPYLVVASHHPSWCLVNPWAPPGAVPRVLADEVLRVLLDEPRVVVWLAGHVHRHEVVHHRRGDRVLPEITAASLIDWPQQARALELVREPGGTLALVSTALDHGGPQRARPHDHPGWLAGLSRQLARNAPLVRDEITRGDARGQVGWWGERNCVVRVPDPG